VVAAAAIMVLGAAPSVASASDDPAAGDDGPATTLAGGLDGPRQLDAYLNGRFVVAESDTGEVSSVDPETGDVKTLLSIKGDPQGVDYERGRLYVTLGEVGPPPDEPQGPPPPPDRIGSALLVADTDGKVLDTIDLLAYELAHNPDGQPQFDDKGMPFDALSNPFAVEVDGNRIFVADAGANDVLLIDRGTGKISTFFVPPRVSPDDVAVCATQQANPGVVGCDPVPTGVKVGPDGKIYVSTLGAEAPDAARIYVLSPSGKVVDRIDDLNSVAGIAVDTDGTVYASELLEGAPAEDPPPAGFDPATVGQVVRIGPHGGRSYAQVTMPSGLEIQHGRLYASAWSIAGFLGLKSAGELVRVHNDAFVKSSG
jgi:DNA-binding beta-propeller fold protein YncE